MPRRRMIDPSIWKDPAVAKLSVPERLLFIGMISNADDEGRVIATPEALKADIFPYDRKITARSVKRMRDSLVDKMQNVVLYENDQAEYISLLRWKDYQKPKHFKLSKLPAPPIPLYDERGTPSPTEGETSGETQGLPSLGQSGQTKSGIGKITQGLKGFDFRDISNDHDLTDYLTTLLNENIPRGSAWGAEVVGQFWEQTIGQPDSTVFQGGLAAVKHYSSHIIAQALVKARNYGAGKHHSWNYVEKILEEINSKTTNGRE